MKFPLKSISKLILMLFLFLYGLWGSFHPQAFGFINGVNLLFHEAGHVFFGFLGQSMGIWGGTIMQLFLPFCIAVAFMARKDIYGACVMFFWFGQNLIPVSEYIKDARAQMLPYVGGEIHDWFYILSRAHLLEFDRTLGDLVWWAGVIVMTYISFCGSVYCLRTLRTDKGL